MIRDLGPQDVPRKVLEEYRFESARLRGPAGRGAVGTRLPVDLHFHIAGSAWRNSSVGRRCIDIDVRSRGGLGVSPVGVYLKIINLKILRRVDLEIQARLGIPLVGIPDAGPTMKLSLASPRTIRRNSPGEIADADRTHLLAGTA